MKFTDEHDKRVDMNGEIQRLLQCVTVQVERGFDGKFFEFIEQVFRFFSCIRKVL